MSYNVSESTITVNVKGSTETEFISATFRATVTTQGKTGPQAKEKAIPIIEKIKTVITGNAKSALIDTERLKTTFSVDLDTDRRTGEFIGYRAVYTINFTGKNVAAAPAVHDALTSIESVQAPTPTYNVNDSAEIHAKAFADAVGKAKVKFHGQCKALGLNHEEFFVASWTIQDERPQGKTLSYTQSAGEAKPVGLEPGKAALDLHVILDYARKP